MHNASIFRIINSAAFLLIFAFGCSSSSIRIPVTRPAEINLKNFNKIALGEIRGRGSRELGDELTLALFESKKFEVLDRQHFDRILAEHKLSLSGLMDESTALKMGQLVGTAALIFGNISEYDYSEQVTHSDHTDKKTGKTTRNYRRKGTAKVTATLQVVDLNRASADMAADSANTQPATKRIADKKPPTIHRKPLYRKCRENSVRRFRRKIAPYQEFVSVSYATDDKMPELQQGYKMAKIGNWDKAIERFQSAVAKYRNSKLPVDKAYYDLGLGFMYTDRFDEARENFETAYQIKAEGKYEQALNKLQQRIEETKRLREQM